MPHRGLADLQTSSIEEIRNAPCRHVFEMAMVPQRYGVVSPACLLELPKCIRGAHCKPFIAER
jgi:hypothetical protein